MTWLFGAAALNENTFRACAGGALFRGRHSCSGVIVTVRSTSCGRPSRTSGSEPVPCSGVGFREFSQANDAPKIVKTTARFRSNGTMRVDTLIDVSAWHG